MKFALECKPVINQVICVITLREMCSLILEHPDVSKLLRITYRIYLLFIRIARQIDSFHVIIH